MAPLKIACALCVSGALLLAAALMNWKATWFFVVPSARITTNGSLYRERHGNTMILVLRSARKSQAYWIALPNKRPGTVSLCGDWAPARIPAFANPPCSPVAESPPPGYVIKNGADYVALVLYNRQVVRIEW